MSGKVFYIFRAASDLIMPRNCPVCGRALLPREKYLCIWCLSGLPLTYFWLQSRNSMADKLNLMIQRDLESEAEGSSLPGIPYSSCISLFFYRSHTGYRKITQRLKYQGDIPFGKFFARRLGTYIAECRYLCSIDIIVPVPLHWTRRWSRGYNQAEIIAGEIARITGIRMVPEFLKRNRITRTQTKLSVSRKSENVRGAFSVNAKYVGAGRKFSHENMPVHILLVDDVFTTGATLNACIKAIRICIPDARVSVATLGFVG